jgi:hypothetical protein
VRRTEVGPGTHRHRPSPLPALRERGDDGGQRCELLGGGLAAHDAEEGALAHSGMFPCFLGGSVSRLFASTRSALITWIRVCDGGMTASTKPRSAAM